MYSITMATAAVAGLIFMALSVRVIGVRFAGKHLIGDGGDEALTYRIRAHGNFAEYIPLCLILMLLIEAALGARTGLWVSGVLLILGRLLHAWGMTFTKPNKPRVFGMMLTFLVLMTLSSWALLLAFGLVS